MLPIGNERSPYLSWEQMDHKSHHFPRDSYDLETPEWLVELRPIQHPELSVVEIVRGSGEFQALRNAYETRNVPNTWYVSKIERG